MRFVEGVASVDDVDAFVARLNDVAADHDVTVQAFDARYVVSRPHLERALELADRAFERGENVARDRSVEILLYAAGRRQIDQALTLGVSEGEVPVVVVVDAESEDESAAEAASERAAAEALELLVDGAKTLGRYDAALVREYFDVTDEELAATLGGLEDVVLERVALLDVEK